MADRKRIGPEEDALLGCWKTFARWWLEDPEDEWNREFYIRVNNGLVHIQNRLRHSRIPKPGWVEDLEELADRLEELFGDEGCDQSADTWSEFLAGHPELTTRTYLPRLELDDDDQVVEAVATACEEWNKRHPGCTNGVWSRCVANVLHGRAAVGPREGPEHVALGDVIRVGQHLARLARQGRLELVSKTYESRRYVSLEVATDA